MNAARDEAADRSRWLRPLMEPRSVAVIGASGRPGRPGHEVVAGLGILGAPVAIYPVTPRYERIGDHRCCGSIRDLPEPVDLAVIASGRERIAAEAEEALAAGARSLFILGSAAGVEAGGQPLLGRLGDIARAASVPLLGPNSIGYVNYARRSLATWIPPAEACREAGRIALICQSGAIYACVNALDPRLKFSLTAQPGQEAALTLTDLMLYALSLPETAVLGLYIEAVRDPQRFREALAVAEAAGVPVVVLKPGRTGRARQAMATHSGRLAGEDAGMAAVFERHGVHRVDNLDELWTTLRLFACGWKLGPGGIAAITDSGGVRSMLIDEAAALGLELADLAPATRAALRRRLAPELEPDNPVDIWSGEENLVEHAASCLASVTADPAAAVGLVVTEFGTADVDGFASRMGDAALHAARDTGKPVAAVCYSTRQFFSAAIMAHERAGLPVLDGIGTSLRALRHLFRHRDRAALRDPVAPMPLDRAALDPAWRRAAAGGEFEALALLDLAGIPAVPCRLAASGDEAVAAAAELGLPVALKTAMNHAHKTELGGVALGLATAEAVRAAYVDMAERLGPRVSVARMAPAGVEVVAGIVRDPDFGPLIMVGAGGTLVEILQDTAFALAPVTAEQAQRMIARLRLAALLRGVRGGPPADVPALALAVANLSRLGAAFADEIEGIDVNPLIVGPRGCVAVDALIRPRAEPS